MKIFRIGLLLFLFFLTTSAHAQVPLERGSELSVAGLNDTVEVLRDEWGVPHIYASNIHDLFFAQGYTQAQDRWWQMEFYRHTGSGTIQELTGKRDSLMGTDYFLRVMGFRHIAEQEAASASEELKAILQAFADGVNAYITSHEPNQLAIEYQLLRLSGVSIEIQPWTAADTLVWAKMMSLDLGSNRSTELLLSRAQGVLSEEMIADWRPGFGFGVKPTIVQPEDIPAMQTVIPTGQTTADAGIVGINMQLPDEQLAQLAHATGVGIGSNNWVAHGSMTKSGMPLMANDMHLGIQMPSIWYEIGLHCQPVSETCPFNAAGFTFATSPMIVAGHNDRISWAYTNVAPDTQDLYVIRVNPDDDLQYEWNGEWRDMTVREETLNFGDGADPMTFQVRETHWGPIITDSLDGFNNDTVLALRWTALDPGTLTEALYQLNLAQNFDQFRDALRQWDTPAQNIIYADVDGNIGYQTPGNIPIRAPGHTGELPVPGWTDEYKWRGYIPFDYLPTIYNPARGYIATANQALVPPEYYNYLAAELGNEFGADANYVISRSWAPGYRADRIVNLLEELAPHNSDTFRQIHGDNYDGSAAEIVPFLADLEINDEILRDALDWLLQWDYQFDMDSSHAVLYAHFWARLVQNLYDDQLAGIGQAGGTEWWATYLLLQDPQNVWWDDVTTEELIETRDDILLRSFEEGYRAAVESLGEDRSAWRWGALHTLTYVSNPLGLSGIPIIENRVNRGPVEVAGTASAVNSTRYSLSSGNFTVNTGPSQRAIYDLSDWDNSQTITTNGQSGHPDSEHYDDMIDLWRNIEYHPMLWSRARVEAATVQRLVLMPEN